jgi:hypothetical protein
MHKVGNEDSGYSVDFDASTRTVQVVAWGFWSSEIAAGFSKAVVNAWRGARNATRLAIDASGLKPQNEAGQAAFRTLLELVSKLAIARTSVTTRSPLTKMQLLRLVNEVGAKDLVELP